jgi:hypothetical protein
MAQGTQQFTPAQILEAGKRAEIEGRVEYAIQFYRHLTDHLPRSPEAMLARDALAKIGALGHPPETGRGTTAGMNGTGMNGAGTNGAGINGHYANGGHASTTSNTAQSAYAPSNGPPHTTGSPTSGRGPAARRTQPPIDAVTRPSFLLPKSRRRYRTGRFTARLFTVLGFMQVGVALTGVAIGVLAAVGLALPAVLAFAAIQPPAVTIVSSITLAVVGLAQVLGGQLARALFDTASANRDLAAYTRAKAAFDTGTPDAGQFED